MADSSTPIHGIEALKRHATEHVLDMCMWAIRAVSVILTFAYFIPIFGYIFSTHFLVLRKFL